VKQTALSHEADISTLLVVKDRASLALQAGVAYLYKNELKLPKYHSYYLDWSASSHADMKKMGPTAYVAVSGEALCVQSYDELIDKSLHPALKGLWDSEIYPHGLDHEQTGFGCLYAVPLRRSAKGLPRDSVIGVFKIERRRYRTTFTEEDRKIFDLVAANLGLILQTFYRVQNRVMSDVAHAIGGGLGRTYHVLTICEHILSDPESEDNDKIAYLSRHLPVAIALMDRACGRLDTVLAASRDPDRITEESVAKLWKSVVSEVELKADVKLDETKVVINLQPPITGDTKLRMRSIEYHDLSSILGNLLDNAIRHSFSDEPVAVTIMLVSHGTYKQLVFRVIDKGRGIPADVIESVEGTLYAEIFRLPGAEGGVKGTGLRRVFGLADHNAWKVSCEIREGTMFEICTPDFRVPSKTEGGAL
jgi:anti-sigma regulatory factor (Ser/Thr protein kinase)